jgi:hypothetical protein
MDSTREGVSDASGQGTQRDVSGMADDMTSAARGMAGHLAEETRGFAEEQAWSAAKSELDEQLDRNADGKRAGPADQAGAATEPVHAATLVPSDHGAPTETTGHDARREAAQRSE